MPTVSYTIDAVLTEDHSGDFPNPFEQRPPDGTFDSASIIFTGMVGEFPAGPALITGHRVRFSTGDAVPLFAGADKFLFATPFWSDPTHGPLPIFTVDPSDTFHPWFGAGGYDADTGIMTIEFSTIGDPAFTAEATFPGLIVGTIYGYHQPSTHWHGEFSFGWEYPDDTSATGLVTDMLDMAAAVI